MTHVYSWQKYYYLNARITIMEEEFWFDSIWYLENALNTFKQDIDRSENQHSQPKDVGLKSYTNNLLKGWVYSWWRKKFSWHYCWYSYLDHGNYIAYGYAAVALWELALPYLFCTVKHVVEVWPSWSSERCFFYATRLYAKGLNQKEFRMQLIETCQIF